MSQGIENYAHSRHEGVSDYLSMSDAAPLNEHTIHSYS